VEVEDGEEGWKKAAAHPELDGEEGELEDDGGLRQKVKKATVTVAGACRRGDDVEDGGDVLEQLPLQTFSEAEEMTTGVPSPFSDDDEADDNDDKVGEFRRIFRSASLNIYFYSRSLFSVKRKRGRGKMAAAEGRKRRTRVVALS
jgi:hypothetical protein